ncbi:MAG: peptide chain release factor-like protein [Planctomycetota bacterium]
MPNPRAQWPRPDECLPVTVIDSPHPAIWPVEQLMKRCDMRTQTRSGPGGQHRNRTESGVFAKLVIDDTDGRGVTIIGEATEQRLQARNRTVAIQRLRMNLAIGLRTPSRLPTERTIDVAEQAVIQTFTATSMRLANDNERKPSLLAVLLNDLHACGGQPSLLVDSWRVSTSRLTSFIRSVPAAWTWLNQLRQHHGRRPLQ